MGTSINQRSPNTPNWRVVSTAYTNNSISVDRAVQEIWRAATNQPTGDLSRELGNSIVAECFRIAVTAESREQAIQQANLAVAFSGQASLAADIAQRAVVQSFRTAENRAGAFAAALFAEAGNYLVSRDLPGFVGPSGRAKNVSESIRFKGEIKTHIAARVAEVPQPTPDVGGLRWRGYVARVVNQLKRVN